MEAAEKEKKAIRHDASKKKRETRPETYEYAEYTIVFTTISRHYFSGEELLARYRYRWQIELAFKRLKSIIGIGHIPKSNPENGKAWLYGKMILALLTELVHREAELFSPWGYPFSGTVKDCQE
jgi:transposase